jgi:hypothetical protein
MKRKTKIPQESIGQFDVPLSNQVHIVIADLLPRSRTWVLLRVWWRWRWYTPCDATPTSPCGCRVGSNRRLWRESRSSRDDRWFNRLVMTRGIPTDTVTQPPCGHGFISTGGQLRRQRVSVWRVEVRFPGSVVARMTGGVALRVGAAVIFAT